MVAVSISVEGWAGLTWPIWQQVVVDVERLGFAGLFLCDHFTLAAPPAQDAPELVVALSYLADHTSRLHFGPLVASLATRDPRILARQAATLDSLSDGRMILGVGAGWNEPEYQTFGYELGDVPTRMARLEEGLEVMTGLLRATEPVSFTGHFYSLKEAALRVPRPGGPPILIGGSGPQRTLPLVARYADIWNGQTITTDEFRDRSARLDELLVAAGRKPSAVKRTMMLAAICARDDAELEAWLSTLRRAIPDFAAIPLDVLRGIMLSSFKAIIGPPEAVAEHIRAYIAAGVEEVMIQWFSLDYIDSLQILAEEVLPLLAT